MNEITRQNCISFLNELEDRITQIDEGEIGAVGQIAFGCKLFAIAFDVSNEEIAKLVWNRVKPHLLFYIKRGWFLPSCKYDDLLGRIPDNENSNYFVRFMTRTMYDSIAFRTLYVMDINNGNFGDSYAF